MRSVLAVMLALFALECRDVQPLSTDTPIQGYQLSGTVTSSAGVPLDSVDVALFYNYAQVSDTPTDTQQVVVSKPLSLVDIAVYTPTYALVRQILFEYRGPGPVARARWDFRDMNGIIVPSGKYLIRYVIDTTIVKYSPVIVDGNSAAATNRFGQFTITNDRFPFGDVFDIYNGIQYIGTYRILSSIDLEFRKLTQITGYASVELTNGKITVRTFILQ